MSSLRAPALVLPLSLAALGTAQSVTLRYKPPVGKTASYVTTMSMTTTVPGMAAPTTIVQTIPTTTTVVSRSGGLTTVRSKTGQVKVTVPPNSPMAAQKATMEQQASNVTSTTVVDEFGGVKSSGMQGGSAMMRQMGASITAGVQGVTYPKGPMKPGSTWSTSIDLGKMMGGMGSSMGMGMKATGKIPVTYRLVSASKGGATIAMTMKGTTTMTMNAPGAPGGKPVTMSMSLNATGTIVVDPATGLLQSMTSVSDNVMNVMGMNMKQHMTQSMKAR